jgi:radical SAM/Cys-rich protein
MHATLPLLRRDQSFPAIRRGAVETLQVNLGYRCNQSCTHCHVAAGPNRTEEMSSQTIDSVLHFIAATPSIKCLDLTGGAPEMNPRFRYLVATARAMGLRVIDRCNLTILEEPGYEALADFLAEHQVEVVASLPCYTEDLVDRQRGQGVFQASIRSLQKLNALGYGREGTGLVLNLVYNPPGATLPPAQLPLEASYRASLGEAFGIVFTGLFTLANMPIQRFGSTLVSKGQFNQYMDLLKKSHRPSNLDDVMCRSLISVDWEGYIYDCDFNQQLGLAIRSPSAARVHISAVPAAALNGGSIAVADHCYGCTAGQGSSCGGAIARAEAA